MQVWYIHPCIWRDIHFSLRYLEETTSLPAYENHKIISVQTLWMLKNRVLKGPKFNLYSFSYLAHYLLILEIHQIAQHGYMLVVVKIINNGRKMFD